VVKASSEHDREQQAIELTKKLIKDKVAEIARVERSIQELGYDEDELPKLEESKEKLKRYTRTRVCVCVCVCVYVCIYKHIYVFIFAHKHTHTHTNTNRDMAGLGRSPETIQGEIDSKTAPLKRATEKRNKLKEEMKYAIRLLFVLLRTSLCTDALICVETFATLVVALSRAECANVIGRARQADQEKIAFVKRDKQVPLHDLGFRIS
jgi:hypothetical protein